MSNEMEQSKAKIMRALIEKDLKGLVEAINEENINEFLGNGKSPLMECSHKGFAAGVNSLVEMGRK